MQKYVDSAVKMYSGQEYIYTNSWPCYTTRPAVILKKMNPSVKWIASFSDPINHSPYKFDKRTYEAYPLPLKICFNLYLKYYVVDEDEANAFDYADTLVFICEVQRDFMIEQYMRYYHHLSEVEIRKKCVVVPLNYVPEWEEISPKETVHTTNDCFTLSHFGRIYGLRIIEEFIYAVKSFSEKHPSIKLKIHQYGEFRKSDLKLIKKLNLEHIFEIHKKIPYKECIDKMNSSDAVLLFDTILPESQLQPYLPSKLMEYSLLQKNVLAVTTSRSPSYQIMKKTNALACRYDQHEIEEGLEKLIIDHQESKVEYRHTNEEAVQPLLNLIN